MLKKILPFGALVGLALGAAVAPSGAATTPSTFAAFRANLRPVPHNPAADAGSNASGTAVVVQRDQSLRVSLAASGLSAGLPHAMHIHGDLEAMNECPSLAADGSGDGLIDTVEGLPDYGPIQVSFTTSGGTSGAIPGPDALDLSRFPVAGRSGVATYSRTIDVAPEVAESLGSLHIVVHGHDLNGNGTYDGPISSVLSSLAGGPVPLEAELPVACGTLRRLGR